MALIELSKVIAADPAAGRTWETEPIPLTDRLTAIMAAQFATLPGHTRAALLLAAVADSPDVTAAVVPGLSADALAPAEAAGLISVDSAGPQFSHPLSARPFTTLFRSPSGPRRTCGSPACSARPSRRCAAWQLARSPTRPGRAWPPGCSAVRTWGIPDRAELQRLAGLTHPVFVANGDSDPRIPPRYSHLIAGLLPNESVKIYPDAAHGFLFQQDDEFAGDVTEFLN